MSPSFKCVGLIGKYGSVETGDILTALNGFLASKGCKVLIDKGTTEVVSLNGIEAVSRPEIGEHCDLAIVIGGDGTLLNAARSLAAYEVPLVGVNMGRLGFLADISPDNMTEKLAQILDGDFLSEDRLLLKSRVFREGVEISRSVAFNDVVIHKWEEARMLEFETLIDGKFVNTQRSDGLIVATPTGSTAYALSGGGPILHPTLDAIVLVPICPHTLSQRPLAVHANSEIEIVISEAGHGSAQITGDGQINLSLMARDRIKITKLDRAIRLIHPVDYNYYDVLRAKLHWGEKL